MSAPALNLAERIEAEHQAAIGAARTAIEHAVECGNLLLQAKKEVGHGGWLAWVDANLSFGHRQAQKYTRLAEFSAKVPNANSTSHLTIDGALAAIAEPATKPSRPKPKPKWEPLNPPKEEKPVEHPAAPVAEPPEVAFEQPPPGRPRLNLDKLEEIKRAYDLLAGVDRNAFALWVLKHQLRQTDLTARQKGGLAKVLEALTTYSGEAP